MTRIGVPLQKRVLKGEQGGSVLRSAGLTRYLRQLVEILIELLSCYVWAANASRIQTERSTAVGGAPLYMAGGVGVRAVRTQLSWASQATSSSSDEVQGTLKLVVLDGNTCRRELALTSNSMWPRSSST